MIAQCLIALSLVGLAWCMNTSPYYEFKDERLKVFEKVFKASVSQDGSIISALLDDVDAFKAVISNRSLFKPDYLPERLIWEAVFKRRGKILDSISNDEFQTMLAEINLRYLRDCIQTPDDTLAARKFFAAIVENERILFKNRIMDRQLLRNFVLINQLKGILDPRLHLANQHRQFVTVKEVFGVEVADNLYFEGGRVEDFLISAYAEISADIDQVYLEKWEKKISNRVKKAEIKQRKKYKKKFDRRSAMYNKATRRLMALKGHNDNPRLGQKPNGISETAAASSVESFRPSPLLISELVSIVFPELIKESAECPLQTLRLVCWDWSRMVSFRFLLLNSTDMARVFIIRLKESFNVGTIQDFPWHLFASSKIECLGLVIRLFAIHDSLTKKLADLNIFEDRKSDFFREALMSYLWSQEHKGKKSSPDETLIVALAKLFEAVRSKRFYDEIARQLDDQTLARLARLAIQERTFSVTTAHPELFVRMAVCAVAEFPELGEKIAKYSDEFLAKLHLAAKYCLGQLEEDDLSPEAQVVLFPNGLPTDMTQTMEACFARGNILSFHYDRQKDSYDDTFCLVGEYFFNETVGSGVVPAFIQARIFMLDYMILYRHDQRVLDNFERVMQLIDQSLDEGSQGYDFRVPLI